MAAPGIAVQDVSREKISKQPGFEQCEVVFRSDDDLQHWEARAGGTGPGSGILVGKSQAIFPAQNVYPSESLFPVEVVLAAGQDGRFEVQYDEIGNDGTYQIKVYGQNLDGEWGP